MLATLDGLFPILKVWKHRNLDLLTHTYNAAMARGWESKAVEEQISAQETQSLGPAKRTLSPLEVKHHAKREGLLLARKRTLVALQTTRDGGYREILERALEHLDTELAGLGPKISD